MTSKKMIRENTRVATLVAKEDFPEGTIGVVVSLYASGTACEVELWDENECPVDVVTYLLDELCEVDHASVSEAKNPAAIQPPDL